MCTRGWGAPSAEVTPVHSAAEEGNCGRPVLQEVVQGMHCLEGMPVSSPSLPAVARLSALLGLFLPRMARADGFTPSPVLGWRQP